MKTLSVIGSLLCLLGTSFLLFAGDFLTPFPPEGFAKVSDETERAFKQVAAADFVAWYSTDEKLNIGIGRTDKKDNLHHPIRFSLEELEDFFDEQKHKDLIVLGIEKHVWTDEVLKRHIAKLRDYFVARGYARVVIQQAYAGGRGIHLDHVAKPKEAEQAAPSNGDKPSN